ncbi:unnamed protein product [Paramecium sonneborni]|uniref:Uncharacterized protein n=1 Tax=Paramecium sonneborni TaxID=65129 RepID=A0A8S1PHT5_9CILI|nr:unnamed protein product [Paramecium sonneborni]
MHNQNILERIIKVSCFHLKWNNQNKKEKTMINQRSLENQEAELKIYALQYLNKKTDAHAESKG